MVALNHNVHFWNEIKNAGIVVVLLVAYLFLMVPYVIRVKVDQIVQVSEVDQGHRTEYHLTRDKHFFRRQNSSTNYAYRRNVIYR